MPRHLPHLARLGIVLAPLVLATACSSVSADPAPVTPSSADPAAAAELTVDNCGTVVTPEGTPDRIVTVKSTTTELLVELGLADRIVGAAFLDGPVEPPYTTLDVDIPVMSDFLPGQEATLALDPDAIVGGWESNFAADGVGERADLAALGILTYVAPSACKEAGYQPDPMTFDLLFAQIEEAGLVFGAEQAAAALVETMRDGLAAVEPSTSGLTAVWYSSGDDAPYVGAGIGAPQMMMDAAGLTNVFADVHDTWTSATWEAVVEADPDVIVLVDASWNTAASKIERLESDPATASLTAVREGRYLVIPFAAGEAGVRNVEAVASLTTQLDALGLS
ncbi:putative F420-0 ABC transporter substrate-binding protein [Demequina sp. SYSU T00039]|uniref:F420-0 ABC transporter substrate-binding protein n=1 Tax=Demequina lignilytica TaxID=3051663 RepID=A0AAW7M547_9MICO|nr:MULTISPECIES: putative F420-0 ABC transporter substrate-binding protein [unclassified Demequina]MDN4479189.1 putative F420-0 ABC transporter substrate-binding protein [Demequina sp. SYSU T00039-1]MDN4487952.1 putative F420-0 ABC transporter substrate-binding protein [Demequina sp. SYSU T00039]MDN4491758.1 putative F420-0 ABC transporter substrate-binding protein [Demequina sp. SYSU T00068]